MASGVRAAEAQEVEDETAGAHARARAALERRAYGEVMWTVLVILLVAWAVLSIVGFVFEGLLWLAVVGIVLIVGTIAFGVLRQRAARAKR